jgi:hypothetical protein
MVKRKLPNYIIPGAQKGGTTFLFNVLEQHPQICASGVKEVHFFDIEENFARGLEYYSSFFNNSHDCPIVCEATPSYMMYPHIAERLYQALGPDLKLTFMLRHPVDRAFSQYAMSLAGASAHRNLTMEDFPKILENSFASGAVAGFGPTGLYTAQLKRFWEFFPRENTQVLLFEEDVRGDIQTTLDKVCKFIGVSSYQFDTEVARNPAGVPKIKAINRMMFNENSPIKRAAKALVRSPFLRDRLRSRVLEMNLTPRKEELDPQQRIQLFNHYYKEDVAQLEELLGRDLACWRN